MVATARRSLLDPVPTRLNGRGARSLATVGDDELPGTHRHYVAQMEREFGRGRAPGLHDIIAGAFGMASCADDSTRKRLSTALARTMTEFSGASGGFALAAGMSEDIWDQARTVLGPASLCNWEPVKNREEWIPVSGEASLAIQNPGSTAANQGISALWGFGETAFPSPTDDTLAQVLTIQNRLLIQSIVSRDVASDAQRVLRWLKYRGYRAIRLSLESAMLYGAVSGPQGVLKSPSTIVVNRGSGGTVGSADIDLMASKLYAGCAANAVWHMGVDTLKAIDGLSSAGGYPELIYARPGASTNGVFATLRGRPVIVLETSPPLGQAGDVILCDWSQYALTFLQRNPMDSPLSFGFAPPRDNYHLGMVGMREDAVESLISTDNLFDTDRLMINFRFRGDGNFLWPQTKTTGAALTVGPAVRLF